MAIQYVNICAICYQRMASDTPNKHCCKGIIRYLPRWLCSYGKVYVDRTNAINCDCRGKNYHTHNCDNCGRAIEFHNDKCKDEVPASLTLCGACCKI